ncbi:MAG TPA: Na+/H+ antiporter subunit E [Phototrophicaceae bacterium]|nr:Na+/H+ antiporter subunit E [Phototrophicaceae bacterium]
MMAILLLALPLALVWMVVTATISVGSLFVGWLIGVALLLLIRREHKTIQWNRLPDQIVAFLIYSVTLGRDVINCSLDVAKRVIQREMPINPGILAVPTQDASENDVIAAFSAHGITITPGELVLDFDGAKTMYVHCLDVEASAQSADGAQTKRLHMLQRIIGADA